MNSHLIKTNSESEIVSTRLFNAPKELVYRAWSEPEHLIKWWGPAGFTNTFHEFNFKVGGRWSFVMHGPDKGNYANECEFIIIEEASRIAWKRHSKPLFQVLVTFETSAENKTKLVFKMLFSSAEECKKLKPFVIDKNEENFDKLEVELLTM